MKILIATGLFPPDIGGPATYSKLLSDELPKSGIAVTVESFGRVRHMPKGIRHIAYVLRLLWAGREADALFAQDTVSVGLPALLVAYLFGKPFIVRVPGDYAWEQGIGRYGVKDSIDEFQNKKYGLRVEFLRSVQKLVVHQADKVIAPSLYFSKLVGAWGNANTISIYNGVDVAEIRNFARDISFKPKTIISAGRLVSWKGFDMLIRSLKKLDGWKLEIAGDGPDLARLKALITDQGMSGRVTLLGRLERGELVRKIASAEIFALNTGFESFSFQTVEVMAAGTPVIVTDVGSLPEIADQGKAGLLIKLNDESGLVSAVTRLSSDSALRNSLIANARKQAEAFSIQNTVSATKKALADIHASPAPTPKLKRRQRLAKLVRYLFSGGTAAVTDLVLLYVFTDILHVWYVASSILAFLVAFAVSFTLQKFFTFQDHGIEGMRGQAALYLAVTGTNLALNTGLIYMLVQFTGLHYIPAQIVTSILIAIESYAVYGMFIFKKS